MARIDLSKTRAGLPVRAKPYWRTVRRGAAIGYRVRGSEAGTWVARIFLRGKMHETRIGDAAEFTYQAALAKAEAWFASMDSGVPRAYDVLAAIEGYALTKTEDATPRALATFWRDLRSLAKHITGELLGREVSTLTTGDLESWRAALPVKAATKRRVFVVLAAALSNANRLHGVGDLSVWRRVKAVKIPKATRSRLFIPTEAEIKDLISKCEPDFAAIVRAALLTGMRYGEIASLECRDLDPKKGTLEVRGKTGERTMMLSTAALAYFAEQVKGKTPRASIFTTAEGGAWLKSMQHRRMRAATSIRAFIFYSLRHYAISKQLSAGIPSALVAKNAGTSEKMLREHYHKFIVDTDRAIFDRAPAIA
jgi:integrase